MQCVKNVNYIKTENIEIVQHQHFVGGTLFFQLAGSLSSPGDLCELSRIMDDIYANSAAVSPSQRNNPYQNPHFDTP